MNHVDDNFNSKTNKFMSYCLGSQIHVNINNRYTCTHDIFIPMKPYFKENHRGLFRDMLPKVRVYIYLYIPSMLDILLHDRTW